MPDFDLSAEIEFAENPEPRCPCVLLIDTSQSMRGERINALAEGLSAFRKALVGDLLASLRVEVAIATFSSRVETVQEFATPDRVKLPTLSAEGKTHMGSAVLHALQMIEDRKALYRANDIDYYRPWVFLLTDGAPQGENEAVVRQAAERVREMEENNGLCFFAIGFGDADMQRLERIAVRPPVKLRELKFEDLFLWVSKSMRSAAAGMDSQEPLPPPPE